MGELTRVASIDGRAIKNRYSPGLFEKIELYFREKTTTEGVALPF